MKQPEPKTPPVKSVGTSWLELYPETRAGGFSRVDGTIAFYQRINALITEIGPSAVVLDFGAGRGQFLEDEVMFRRELRNLRGRVDTVIGLDVDDAVLTNKSLDRAEVIAEGRPFPLADGAIDLIISDFTFEHVTNPEWVTSELDRVLRVGGWLCARTPNRRGYIGLGGRIVPNQYHQQILHRLQPGKQCRDTFPTAYRLNTPKTLRSWFNEGRYEHIIYATQSEPNYAGRSLYAARLTKLLLSLTPPPLRSMLFIYLRKLR